MKFKMMAVLLFIFIILAGCSSTSNAPKEAKRHSENEQEIFKLTTETMPRIDGSTANIPMIRAFVAQVLNFDQTQAQEYVVVSGTDRSYEALFANTADILFVYEPSPQIKESHYFKSFELAPIGSDALVFLVNRNNPVKNLSTNSIQEIYTGKVSNWKAFGGEDKEIIAFQRNSRSGSQTLMEMLCMKEQPMAEAPQDRIVDQMMGLITSVKNYDHSANAIGYSVFYYADTMLNHPEIKFLDVDGVTPTNQTIQSGSYPYINNFYVVIRKNAPMDSPARRIFEWMQSESGQTLVKECGYVSIQ